MTTAYSLIDRLDLLNTIGVSLSRERDINKLLESILLAAKKLTNADGGTLYLVSSDKQFLQFKIVRNDSLGIAWNAEEKDQASSPFTDIPLYINNQQNHHMIAAYSATTGLSVNIADAYLENEHFDFSGTKKFDEKTGYRSKSFLSIPMKDHEDNVIGVFQLINAVSSAGDVEAFTEEDQKFAESLASQAAVALTNRLLVHQLEKLFEATIQMINTAIDEKSPYTAGHCQRVPELTMMLAEAINEETDGPLASFTLSDKDRYELKIASLLHDCGKITTPVHIIDKSSKLECIFDRIALIDARFEAVRHQAEARKWHSIAEGNDPAVAEQAYQHTLAQLQQEQTRLKQINQGSQRLNEDDIQFVQGLAQRYHWQHDATQPHPFLTDNEVSNLLIRAGTLSDAERQIINRHAELTIKMLRQLPWPEHLKNVPEYAGGHHERYDGKGYPNGLNGQDMSIQARAMAIADIFEALTACDRPYKQPMHVSKALAVLDDMQKNGHIDPEIFRIFVERQVHTRYAASHLPSSQYQ